MAYNGSGGKRLCTGTDLDVERVSLAYSQTMSKFDVVSRKWPCFIHFPLDVRIRATISRWCAYVFLVS